MLRRWNPSYGHNENNPPQPKEQENSFLLAAAQVRRKTALSMMYLMSAVFRGSYGALIRGQRTQVKFHLGVRDLETGLLRANPLIRTEMIGSAQD